MTKKRDDDDYLGRKVKMSHPTGNTYSGVIGGILRGVGITIVDENDKGNICYCTDGESARELGTTLDAQIDYLLDCIDKNIPFDSLEFLVHEGVISSEEADQCKIKVQVDSLIGKSCGSKQEYLKARCKF